MQPPTYLYRPLQIVEGIESSLATSPSALPLLQQFPRDMAKIISYGYEIPIFRQTNLSIQSAARYLCILSGRNPHGSMPQQDRKLYGLLHVGPPATVILLDADLPDRMANYVIAHELGHFVGDLLIVQQRWLTQLPDHLGEIMRLFAWQPHDHMVELLALLHGLPPRPLPILERGSGESLATEARERQADLIARELLAPWKIVATLAQHLAVDDLSVQLSREYGLPRHVARNYANEIRTTANPPRDLIDRLFAPFDS